MQHFSLSPNGTIHADKHHRLIDVYDLEFGKAVFLIAQNQTDFSDRARFGPRTQSPLQQNPAGWLAQNIEKIAQITHAHSATRPVLIPIPIAAVMDENCVTACHAALSGSPLCPQEVCLELDDATVTLMGNALNPILEALLRHGFRIGINASVTATAPLSEGLRLLVDTYRVDVRCLDRDRTLQDRIEAAAATGLSIIAENARWRDGPFLAQLGIQYALSPGHDD